MTAYVGGVTAARTDLSLRIADRLLPFILGVATLSFLLLMVAYRSLVIPAKAAAMNLLSISAAYGVVVAVFQWGWGAQLIGLDGPVPIESYVPMMMFAVLFGLSMDYEVFLLTAFNEHYQRTGDIVTAVRRGLADTGQLITAAALIMVAVFTSFVIPDNAVVKMFGVGLATAVLVDATIVRCILVPSLMVLAAKWTWWLPGWLDRALPQLHIEGDPAQLESVGTVRTPQPSDQRPATGALALIIGVLVAWVLGTAMVSTPAGGPGCCAGAGCGRWRRPGLPPEGDPRRRWDPAHAPRPAPGGGSDQRGRVQPGRRADPRHPQQHRRAGGSRDPGPGAVRRPHAAAPRSDPGPARIDRGDGSAQRTCGLRARRAPHRAPRGSGDPGARGARTLTGPRRWTGDRGRPVRGRLRLPGQRRRVRRRGARVVRPRRRGRRRGGAACPRHLAGPGSPARIGDAMIRPTLALGTAGLVLLAVAGPATSATGPAGSRQALDSAIPRSTAQPAEIVNDEVVLAELDATGLPERASPGQQGHRRGPGA